MAKDVTRARATGGPSRFELAPPRHFLLPVLLLVLSERPNHGYRLVKEVQSFRFGRVDRPSVYRALSQLENDGLVESWSEASTAGQTRRVYGLTSHGERILRTWMGIVKEERDCLDRVLRRYQATGTGDAVLAAVEGGWAAVIGADWSPVSPTSSSHPHDTVPGPVGAVGTELLDELEAVARVRGSAGEAGEAEPDDGAAAEPAPEPRPGRYRLVPDRSVVLIEVRSTVGPLRFGAIGLTGWVEAAVRDGAVVTEPPVRAELEVAVGALRSGNHLYDAELLRRIDARRFPTAVVELSSCVRLGANPRYQIEGALTFHGVTRSAQGIVTARAAEPGRFVITGDQVFDIRDFDVASPTVLMLRIYPDVRVHLHVEAELVE